MPVEMAMWKMTSDGPLAIAPKKLNFEDRLAELVVNDPSLIRIAAINAAAGLPADAPLPAADRARVRTAVARKFFLAEHGREPIDARELTGQIAKDSRPRTQTVAGYDLTFSPVKSVSTLWAVADPAVAAVIERAHQAAVQDALGFIEKHALFTRTGPQGIR